MQINIVASNKFKHSDDGVMCYLAYLVLSIIIPLCIILPQISGYIKFFENGENKSLSWLKMTMCWINTMKFGTRLKKS